MQWGGNYQYNLLKLINMQDECMRIISKSKYNALPLPLYIQNKVLPIQDLVKLEILKFVHKFFHNKLPGPLLRTYVTNQTVHDHSTRQSNDPHSRAYNYALIKMSYLHQGPEIWSKVPMSLKEITRPPLFKSKIKTYLFNLLQS